MGMDRRAFLSWVGVGAIASSLPLAIAACSSDSPTESVASPSAVPAAARPDGFTEVGSVAALQQAGFIQDKAFVSGPLLVVNDPANPSQLIAVNPTCPHDGCAVDWNRTSTEFICPCHNSRFKTDGSVSQGPASKPLTTFIAKTEGDLVLVKGG